MKKPIHLLFFLTLSILASAQITTPIIKAGFGVDAELRANYFDGFLQAGNDDWFNNGTTGTGQAVIDTTGAAAMVSRYLIDPEFRKQPFFRTMRVPQMSVVNNRLWIDAIYIRDYNGQSGGDETAFVLSNKNGDTPEAWKGGTTTVLDKNDISDMFVHVRRAGPAKTDELWFIGGLSLQGTTGSRYFDFELYQTDIFYTRSTGKFSNFGPNAGHTAWEFDAAGNITKPGDVIFSAEYGSQSLSAVEARIWVHRSALSLNSPAFIWGGSFDGASNSSEYGYANIKPKTTGDYYTGLQSGNNTWAGPFKFIDGSNTIKDNYTAKQFMEFSVNLTKLGLDPITLLGGSACGLPFRRILVKTRTSTSFTSELKDFIGPFDFFKTAPVKAQADVPLYCGAIGVSELSVTNPLPSSVYTWTTKDGSFVYGNSGTSVTVDQPGMYYVSQQLLDGCSTTSKDSVLITYDAKCVPMEKSLLHFNGQLVRQKAKLAWSVATTDVMESYTVQRSLDGVTFKNVYAATATATPAYSFEEGVDKITAPYIYYRLLLKSSAGTTGYSKVVRLQPAFTGSSVVLYPNPAVNTLHLLIPAVAQKQVKLTVYTAAGRQVYATGLQVAKGGNHFTIDEVARWQPGLYLLSLQADGNVQWLKFIVGGKAGARAPN